jgi:hypothetical protein
LKPKCITCKKLGHKKDQYHFKKKAKSFYKGKEKMVANAITTNKETNIAEVMSDNEETLAAIRGDNHILTNNPFIKNVYDYNIQYGNLATNTNDHMYDWLADTESTNHISNWHEIFSLYKPTPKATIHSVSGKIIQIAGCGTVILITQYGTQKHTLCLEKVNYIPSNKYNIFALSRWDSQGQRYQVSNSKLTLYDCYNVSVLKRHKITLHIYKFRLSPINAPLLTNNKVYTFFCNKSKQTWETWHKHFGHVSYKGLKKLHDE